MSLNPNLSLSVHRVVRRATVDQPIVYVLTTQDLRAQRRVSMSLSLSLSPNPPAAAFVEQETATYEELGGMDQECKWCKAKLWVEVGKKCLRILNQK